MLTSSPATRQKVKVFAKNAALTAEEAPFPSLNGNSHETSNVTLNLDVAAKLNGQKSFNWADKITVQLSSAELPEFCALLMGYIDSMTVHRADKGIAMERQDRTIFLKATKQGGGMYALPILTGAIFKLNVMTMELLKRQNNTNDANVIIASLRMFAKR